MRLSTDATLGDDGGSGSGGSVALEQMIAAIVERAKVVGRSVGREGLDPAVLQAMQRVPRAEFVDAPLRDRAFDNQPLSIGYGQTLSQPYLVALMTDLVDIGPDSRVLEVGTGSGYQTAVLAELAGEVFSMEIIPELAAQAQARINSLGYANVHLRTGDGYNGWPEAAPFDAIVVTAAPATIPLSLLQQLRPHRPLVLPLGGQRSSQELLRVTRDEDCEISIEHILPVAFVPLVDRR